MTMAAPGSSCTTGGRGIPATNFSPWGPGRSASRAASAALYRPRASVLVVVGPLLVLHLGVRLRRWVPGVVGGGSRLLWLLLLVLPLLSLLRLRFGERSSASFLAASFPWWGATITLVHCILQVTAARGGRSGGC